MVSWKRRKLLVPIPQLQQLAQCHQLWAREVVQGQLGPQTTLKNAWISVAGPLSLAPSLGSAGAIVRVTTSRLCVPPPAAPQLGHTPQVRTKQKGSSTLRDPHRSGPWDPGRYAAHVGPVPGPHMLCQQGQRWPGRKKPGSLHVGREARLPLTVDMAGGSLSLPPVSAGWALSSSPRAEGSQETQMRLVDGSAILRTVVCLHGHGRDQLHPSSLALNPSLTMHSERGG